MKKSNKEADIPDLFEIKKPKVDEEKVRQSWNGILKRLNQAPVKKRKPEQ